MMVESLRSHRSTSSDVTNHPVRADESGCSGNQGSISEKSFELAQTPNFEKDIDSLASYSFPEMNLKMSMIVNPNLVIQFFFLIQ